MEEESAKDAALSDDWSKGGDSKLLVILHSDEPTKSHTLARRVSHSMTSCSF